MNTNKVVHFEIGAEDPSELSEFYRKALGWEINEWEKSGYFVVGKTEDRSVGAIFGGIMKRYKNEKTINTVEVENLDKAIEQFVNAGGSIEKPKAAIPGMMWWTYVADPQGNIIGLMQNDENAK